MLVSDTRGSHRNELVQEKWMQKKFNPDSVLIPKSMTSQRQVIDASKKSFKGHFEKANTLSGYVIGLQDKLKQTIVLTLCEQVLMAWEETSSESFVQGLSQCYMAQSLDELKPLDAL